MHKNLVKFSCTVLELCNQIDRDTDKQTSMLITVLRRPPGDEVIYGDGGSEQWYPIGGFNLSQLSSSGLEVGDQQ